jgi:hypothetical protein
MEIEEQTAKAYLDKSYQLGRKDLARDIVIELNKILLNRAAAASGGEYRKSINIQEVKDIINGKI